MSRLKSNLCSTSKLWKTKNFQRSLHHQPFCKFCPRPRCKFPLTLSALDIVSVFLTSDILIRVEEPVMAVNLSASLWECGFRTSNAVGTCFAITHLTLKGGKDHHSTWLQFCYLTRWHVSGVNFCSVNLPVELTIILVMNVSMYLWVWKWKLAGADTGVLIPWRKRLGFLGIVILLNFF